MSRLFKNLKTAAEAPAEKPEKNAPAKKTPAAAPQADKAPVLGPDPGPKTELLLAWRASGINPRLLTAYRPGTDPTNPNNLVTVNVRSNVNFLPHMRLRVSQVSETVFDFMGALPRWRGRY